MNRWLPTNVICGLAKAQKGSGVTKLRGETGLYIAALTTAKDHQARAHSDDDAYFTALTVNVKKKGAAEATVPMEDMPICQYFCFPELGLAVALRPGDVLFFNPVKMHCCSLKTAAYADYDVHISSYYLKAGHIGLNNNSLPLKEDDKVWLNWKP